MPTKKKNFWLTQLIIIFLTLTACSSQPTPEPVTITLAYYGVELGYIEELITQFNEIHPEITVELQEVYTNDLATYSGVDIFGVDLFSFLENQAQGLFLDLSPLIEQDQSLGIDDFYPGAIDVFTQNGKIWAIPTGVDPFILYYNQDLFDQFGVPYPTNNWTWDDLQTAAMLTSNPDQNIYGYAVPEPYFDMVAMVLIHQHGGQLFDDLYNPTEIIYNLPLNIEALEWYSNLYHLYEVAPTPEKARAAYGGSGNQTRARVADRDIGGESNDKTTSTAAYGPVIVGNRNTAASSDISTCSRCSTVYSTGRVINRHITRACGRGNIYPINSAVDIPGYVFDCGPAAAQLVNVNAGIGGSRNMAAGVGNQNRCNIRQENAVAANDAQG